MGTIRPMRKKDFTLALFKEKKITPYALGAVDSIFGFTTNPFGEGNEAEEASNAAYWREGFNDGTAGVRHGKIRIIQTLVNEPEAAKSLIQKVE